MHPYRALWGVVSVVYMNKLDKNTDKIIIKGARTHNLKNINVEMPRNSMVVITGVSGSGKSSLAFDTIFAEGQRRYVESLSAYARQFLTQLQKPDVDEITGLSPGNTATKIHRIKKILADRYWQGGQHDQ